ncbi:MAG: hypothetical protein OXD54_12890 [Candidatus Poribacteria bacterium]|nr:hypothetical protein [Candidatus Poribacteria bacterium]
MVAQQLCYNYPSCYAQVQHTRGVRSVNFALIVAIIGFVAVPLSFLVYQYNKQREQQREEIETL